MAAVTTAGRASGLERLSAASDAGVAAALYERNASRVFGYCLVRLGRREDAEDAVQTTFLHAVRSLQRGVVPLVESAWLLGIARNVCLARWESAGRRNRLEAVCDPVELDRGSAPEVPREELIGLDDALADLPEQQRRAVLLRDWRGLSYDEVAGQLGVSRACVESLIFRGRRTLAERLRERLAALGNLGSLLGALKSLFTGGAAATTAAAALTVAAVSATGVIAAQSPDRGSPVDRAVRPARAVADPAPATRPLTSPRRSAAPTAATPPTVAPSRRPAPIRTLPTPPQRTAKAPAAAVTPTPTGTAVPETDATVSPVADDVVPPLPAAAVVEPLVEPLVESVVEPVVATATDVAAEVVAVLPVEVAPPPLP